MWIIDPLDGTWEFGERGRDDWAVHVALVIEGRVSRPTTFFIESFANLNETRRH